MDEDRNNNTPPAVIRKEVHIELPTINLNEGNDNADSIPRDGDSALLTNNPPSQSKDSLEQNDPKHVGVVASTRFIVFSSKLNILLLLGPFAIGGYYASWTDGVVFVFSLLAMIPLAALLGDITEELAKHTNQTIGGLLNATFGNATEMIISIIALQQGLLRIVQVSLLGSILSNMLLVMGSAFFLGGLRHKQQAFNKNITSTNSGLLMLGVIGLLYPAVLNASSADRSASSELQLSRYTAVILFCLYGSYLVFQLKTHRNLFEEEETEEEPKELTVQGAVVWLAIVTALISLLSEYLVGAIEGAAKSWNVPQIFIGVILIPIVGNAAEHATALTAAYRNKMELSLGVAIGSATQITLCVIPVSVMIAWMMGKPLSLFFQMFETSCVFSAAVLCNFVTSEGKSTWLSGLMLIFAYLLCAGGFFAHKDE